MSHKYRHQSDAINKHNDANLKFYVYYCKTMQT